MNTFRDKEKKPNKKGGRFQGAYVCRIPISKDYKLKELYSIVNNILYTSVISGARQDCFNVGNNDCAWHQLTTNMKMSKIELTHHRSHQVDFLLCHFPLFAFDVPSIYNHRFCA